MNQPTKKELLVKAMAPKADQLNADDLIAGPKTITITSVKVLASGEQLVSVFYQGDNGKPWKPSKGMMRLMCQVYGDEPDQWIGKTVVLFRKEDVKFGKDTVGGIRISEMSDIAKPFKAIVTVSRGKREEMSIAKYTGKAQTQAPSQEAAPVDYAAKLRDAALLGVNALKEECAKVPEQFVADLKQCYVDSMKNAKRIDAEKAGTYNQVQVEQPPIPDENMVPPERDDIENF